MCVSSVSVGRAWLRIVIPLMLALGLGWPPWVSRAAPVALHAVMEQGGLFMDTGESVVISVADAVRVAVAEPKVADVAAISRNEVLVSARTAGHTTLHIWDQTGLVGFPVQVSENTAELVRQIKGRIGLPGVELWMHDGTVVLEGWVASSAEKQRAAQVAGAYGKVVDLLAVRAAPDALDPTDSRIAELQVLVDAPELQLQVVNDTLLMSGSFGDEKEQEKAHQLAALFFPKVLDVTRVRVVDQGRWPVEVYRIVQREVVQVDVE
jgi:Flp pilus assembly secretin CpaC